MSTSKVEFILVDESGDTDMINLPGLTRKEVANQFIRKIAEVSQYHRKLQADGLHPKVVEITQHQLSQARHMVDVLEQEWLQRVARGEPLGPPREIHPNTLTEDLV